jgi:hypothetical protein
MSKKILNVETFLCDNLKMLNKKAFKKIQSTS